MTIIKATASALVLASAWAAVAAWPDEPREPGVEIAKPDPLICKRIRVTGSHFKRKICQRQSAWREMRRAAQEAVRDLEQRSGAAGASNTPG